MSDKLQMDDDNMAISGQTPADEHILKDQDARHASRSVKVLAVISYFILLAGFLLLLFVFLRFYILKDDTLTDKDVSGYNKVIDDVIGEGTITDTSINGDKLVITIKMANYWQLLIVDTNDFSHKSIIFAKMIPL